MSDPVPAEAPASGFGATSDSVLAPHGGALLREAREAQGMHVAALAVSLKVPVRQIEALEADRLDQLPDLVFARALAASVCRQLKIDPQPVLAHLPQGQPRLRKEREPINEPFRPGPSGGRSWREFAVRPPLLVALALLLGAIILLALPLVQGERRDVAPVAAPAPVAPSEPASVQVTPLPGVVTESVKPGAPGGSVAERIPPLVPALPAGPAASR